MTAATLMVIQVPMIATAAPSSLSGGPVAGGGSPSQTDSCIVTVGYGVPPYTYAWEQVSGDGAIQILSPTSDTTAFSCPAGSVPAGGSFRCLVTDARNLTAYSNQVTVELTA